MQETILKQQYKNFAASRSEGLDKTYDSPIKLKLKLSKCVYKEDIAFLKYDVHVKDISIKDLKNQLKETLKEKDDLKLKLEKFEESSKNLTKLINSQISAKDKAGLGYDSQMNKNEVVHSVFNSKESDVDDSPVNDRFKTAKVSKTITIASKTNKDSLEKPKTVRPSAPIIEDWDTDSDNDSVFRPKPDQTKPKFTKINFVKSDENVKSVNKENTHRQEEYPRKSQSPRDNRRNWNGMMTQKLGNGFEFIKKACFVCGSFNHLIKDCDFHDKKMVEKPVLNNKGRVTGQREIRPVWNNAQRVNHQNKFTHPHPKRNFVPTAVVTKSRQVPVNTAKQSSPRATISISTAKPVNTVAPKPKVNDALPITYSYFKAHSPIKRAFNQKSVAKTNKFNEKVNTVRVNNVTTTGPKAVVSATVGNRENVVKSSACWHMTGNKFFLTNYQEIDGGFVAFGGSPKGDPLGKFDEKADEGFFVGYSINSKAFMVFNTRTRKVEENLHITFLENKPNVAGSGPDWLFDIDLLTNSMNYEPVTVGNQTNKNAGIKDNTQQYILLPLPFDSPKSSEDAVTDDAGGASNKEDDQNEQDFRAALDNLLVHKKEGYANSTNRDSTDTANLLNTGIFSGAYDDEDVGAEANLNNLETTMNVIPIPTTRIHKDHPKDQIIGVINLATQTRRMTKISKVLAMIKPKKVTQALADDRGNVR
ncbi:hypothetical protein Tco_0964512 [Tanacetum coccineum]